MEQYLYLLFSLQVQMYWKWLSMKGIQHWNMDNHQLWEAVFTNGGFLSYCITCLKLKKKNPLFFRAPIHHHLLSFGPLSAGVTGPSWQICIISKLGMKANFSVNEMTFWVVSREKSSSMAQEIRSKCRGLCCFVPTQSIQSFSVLNLVSITLLQLVTEHLLLCLFMLWFFWL